MVLLEDLTDSLNSNENILSLLSFIVKRIKGKLAVFDTSILCSPPINYPPSLFGEFRKRNIPQIEQAARSGMLDKPEMIGGFVKYYSTLANIVKKNKTIVTPLVKKELIRNLERDAFSLHTEKARTILTIPLARAICDFGGEVRKKTTYAPSRECFESVEFFKRKGVLAGGYDKSISLADWEGVAEFFELYHTSKEAAFVSADKAQVELLVANAEKSGLNIWAAKTFRGNRWNYVVSSNKNSMEGKGL